MGQLSHNKDPARLKKEAWFPALPLSAVRSPEEGRGPGERSPVWGTHVGGGPFITHFPVCLLMGKEMLSPPRPRPWPQDRPRVNLARGSALAGSARASVLASTVHPPSPRQCGTVERLFGLLAASREESAGSCLPRSVSSHRSVEEAPDTVSSDRHGQPWRGESL